MRSPSDQIRHTSLGAYLLFLGSIVALIITAPILAELVGAHGALVAYEVVAILGAAIVYRQALGDDARPWPSLRRGGLSAPGWAALVVASVGVGLLANVLMGLSVEIVPGFDALAEQYNAQIKELMLDTTGVERALAIIGACVAAPVCEEALFRGTILPELRKSHQVWTAIAINGILFALIHFNPVGFLSWALIGVFLAHVTVRTGALWPAIIGHAAVNTFNGVLLPALAPDLAEADPAVGLDQLLVALAILAPLTALFWWWTIRGARAEPLADDDTDRP